MLHTLFVIAVIVIAMALLPAALALLPLLLVAAVGVVGIELMEDHPATSPEKMQHPVTDLFSVQLTEVESGAELRILEREIIREPVKEGQPRGVRVIKTRVDWGSRRHTKASRAAASAMCSPWQSGARRPLLGHAQRPLIEVDSNHVSALFGERDEIGARAGSISRIRDLSRGRA